MRTLRGEPRHHDPHALPGLRLRMVLRARRQARRCHRRGQHRAHASLRGRRPTSSTASPIATETLVGQAAGARDRDAVPQPRHPHRLVWALAAGVLCSAAHLLRRTRLHRRLTVNADIRARPGIYLPWAALACSSAPSPSNIDGIYTGLMATAAMRNMMLVSLGGFISRPGGCSSPLRQSRPVGGAHRLLRGARRSPSPAACRRSSRAAFADYSVW